MITVQMAVLVKDYTVRAFFVPITCSIFALKVSSCANKLHILKFRYVCRVSYQNGAVSDKITINLHSKYRRYDTRYDKNSCYRMPNR